MNRTFDQIKVLSFHMKPLDKYISIALFTLLVLITGCVVYSYFNPYAQVLLIPMGFMSIYYLILFAFSKLVLSENKISLFIGMVLLCIPVLSIALAYDRFISFSIDFLNWTHP